MDTRLKHISRVTVWGAVVNVVLAAFKFVAGLVGHSSAMLADAIHSLSDLVSDAIVLIMVRASSKAKDEGHDYGHGKYETLATAAVAVLLLVVGAELMADGVGKIRVVVSGGELEMPGKIALIAALVSILSKEVLYQWTAYVGRRYNSDAVVTNAWHHRTDALSSIGSALGIGAALAFGGKWVVLDPIACCAISIFIIYMAVKMGLPALNELTEASLPEDVETEIQSIIASVPGISNVHALKTRKSGPYIIVEAHIVVDPQMSVTKAHDLASQAESAVITRFGEGTQISIHVEPDIDAC